MSETDDVPAPKVPRPRFLAACAVAVGSGFLLALNVRLGIEGAVTVLLFAAWFLGPVAAGAVLRTTRFLPYLAIGVLWFVTTPISSVTGLLSVGDAATDPSGPQFVTTFTLVAIPFVAPLVAVWAYAGGLGMYWFQQRRSAHGVED